MTIEISYIEYLQDVMVQISFDQNNTSYFSLDWKILPSYSKHPRDQLNKADILEALIWVFLGMFCGIMIPKYLPVILKTIRELSSTKVAFRGPPIFLRKSYNRWQIYTWIARNAPNHQIHYSLILGKMYFKSCLNLETFWYNWLNSEYIFNFNI